MQVALSILDDTALRGGIVERCTDAGIALMAHSPLGGPRRVGRLTREKPLAAIAHERGVSPAELALAWLLELAPNIVAIPGARRPETAHSSARAASICLDGHERARLGRDRRARPLRRAATGDVVIVMGPPGAGKSRVAEDYVARGYLRLNRDARGGTLRDLADALDEALGNRAREVVLDNTYLTRASRSYVVETSARYGVATRCIWLDTPLAQAQVNMIERLLDRFGDLPEPEELTKAARSQPGLLAPTQQMRAFRELEPPTDDEGFASVERIPFERLTHPDRLATGVFVAAVADRTPEWERALASAVESTAPHLVFDWSPDGASARLEATAGAVAEIVSGAVEAALCSHAAGPPTCWCRPPLPGLVLEFARRHAVDPARSVVLGASPAHTTLARTLGARSQLF